VQLDRAKTGGEALIGDIEEFFSCVEGNGACIGGNAVAKTSQHLVDRQSGDLGCEVPEGHIDDTESVNRDLLKSIEFQHAFPDVFLVQRILANQDVTQSASEDVVHDRAVPHMGYSADSFVRLDGYLERFLIC
jgi:hypothetical protein